MGLAMSHTGSEERGRYKQAVEELHYVASDFAQIDSRGKICQRTIDTAENLLDFDLSIIALEEDRVLQPKAVSSGLSPDEFDSMSISEGIAGKTYRTGESYLIDDLTTWEKANPQGPWKSVISLPIGDYGNFQALNQERSAFDEEDLQLAELLTTHAANHLDRITHKAQLERQNDRLEEFASIVSHDLRNPLNVAELRLDLAREDCESEHLDKVDCAHMRMETLIDNLLALAREGSTVIAPEPVDLATVAVDASIQVETTDTTFATSIEQPILADESALKQLLENLFRNATEHNDDCVTVTVGELADGFYVEDDGSGIAADKHDTVFETGYSTSKDGTGLGLRIVKQIVEAHGWQIDVTAGSDGGARFEITDVAFPGG